MSGLTEQERKTLEDVDESCACGGSLHTFVPVIERIITARLAEQRAGIVAAIQDHGERYDRSSDWREGIDVASEVAHDYTPEAKP